MSPHGMVALGMLLAALASSAQAQTASAPRRPFHVVHYDTRIEPDIPQQTIRGSVRLDITTTDDQNGIDLDRGSLVVDSVREGRTQQTFTLTDRHLLIQLSHPIHSGEKRTLEIDYHGAPKFGLRFVSDRSQAYTVFSTSQWMVCVDAPEDRSTIRLRVILPRALSVIASGRRVGRRVLPDGTVEHEWRTARAVPTYTFGLAAGRFNELVEKRGGVTLRYLADGFSTAELRRIFRDTSRMIAFFEERAGVPYDGAAYTQVLVAETIGQEMAGFAILPESFGRTVLNDERSVALGAHELAHQWWGNMVTCRSFNHFWLNEGFATFMAAAYDERRFGRQRYLEDIAAARQRYETVRDAGHDRPLVFPDWNRPTAGDRTLVYRKGAYVLHLLREELGEGAFWDGIRRYTRTYFGKSVTTEDFQQVMEQATGRDLAAFFSKWVYLTKAP
jgi:aminopeptidase N